MKLKLKQPAKKTNKKSVVGSTAKKGKKLNFNKAFLITAVFSSLALLGVAGWNTWQFKKIEAEAAGYTRLMHQNDIWIGACRTPIYPGVFKVGFAVLTAGRWGNAAFYDFNANNAVTGGVIKSVSLGPWQGTSGFFYSGPSILVVGNGIRGSINVSGLTSC